MKIKKIFHTFLLFGLLMGSIGVQKARALGTPQIVSINPSSPVQAGTSIRIRVRIDWDSEYRAMRIRFGNEGWQESSETEFERAFGTDNYSPGWYTIRVEAARIGDNDWANPTVAETQFEITGQPEPSKGPAISQFNFNPSGGAIVGDSVNIHIKVDSNNPGATTLTADCGGLSKNETSEVEFDSNWNTNGCPAQAVNILVCSRAVDDPNWTNATCSTRSYTLSSPPVSVPVPTAQLWVDNNQVSKGQCTYLHWQTSNADRVDIDGNTVQNSGDQQICPTVTKKYTLTAINQNGSANRNLTVIVSDQSSTTRVPDYFQTGDIIQIGYDIYVIINGERRLVPNPETLDALGITRNWIDNKGFGDPDLKTIPLGQDIPDVNRDPSGFAAFKDKYFSNTTPIVPGTEPTAPPVPNQPQEPNIPSNVQWQVGARVGLCAGAQIRSGSGFSYPTHTIVPENNWQVEIIGDPRNSDGVTWWNVSRANIDGGGTGWVYFEQAGLCNGGSVLGDSEQTQESIPENNNSIEEQTQSQQNECWGLDCIIPVANASEEGQSNEKVCTVKSCDSLQGWDYFVCKLNNFFSKVGCNGSTSPNPSNEQQVNSETINENEIKDNATQWLSSLNENLTLDGNDCTDETTNYNGKEYKCQCVALAKAITDFPGTHPGYESTANGYYDYYFNNRYVLKRTPIELEYAIENDKIKKCDVLIWHSQASGHMAVVYYVSPDGQVYYVDQNHSGNGENGEAVKLWSDIGDIPTDKSILVVPAECK